MSAPRCDVAVLGAGPGGAVAAAICAARGLDVVVMERGDLWGSHLPESWVGGAAEALDGVSGWRDALRQDTTVVLRSASSGQSVTITAQAGGGEGVRLDRVVLDAILVDHARAAGATVLTGVSVQSVVPPAASADTLIRGVARNGAQVDLSARVVLDASGKSALLGRQLGLLAVDDTDLDPREAVFTHVRPAAPSVLTTPGTMTVTGTPFGYVFVIPIDEGRVSVGVVAVHGHAASGPPAELLEAGLVAVPDVADLLSSGSRILPVIPAMNRTYRCRDVATDWYALLGDAAAFTDPFLGGGLDVALGSGALAAEFAITVLATVAPAEAVRAYRVGLAALLDGTDHRAVASGPGRELLNALTDPHLPPLLPLAAHGHGIGLDPDGSGSRKALAAGRRDFAGAPSGGAT